VEVDTVLFWGKHGFRVGTPVYQFQPELALIGFVSAIEASDPKVYRFYVGIAKKHEIGVLRDDTHFEFLQTSSSFLAILGGFLSKGNGELLKKQMLQVAIKNQKKITGIFARLSEILGRELQNQQLATQILTNPVLRESIQQTLEQEIFSRIDWDGILQSVEKNENAAKITSLLGQHVQWDKVTKQAMETGADRALDEVSSYFIDPKYFSNMEGGRVIKLFAGILSFAANPEKSKQRALRGFEKGAWKGGWGATRHELKKVFKEHHREIMQHGSEVLQKTAKDIELMDKIVGGFQALTKNAQLLNYVKSRYGDHVANALVKTFSEASHDKTIVSNFEEISTEIQDLTAQWFEKFVLNENRTGPNPDLLMAVREGISRKPEPQIICFPGKGLRVPKHYVYQVRGKGGR
jgi:hypothetical protein